MNINKYRKMEKAGDSDGGGSSDGEVAKGFVAAIRKLTETNVTLDARVKTLEDAIARGLGTAEDDVKKGAKKAAKEGKSFLDELDEAVAKLFE